MKLKYYWRFVQKLGTKSDISYKVFVCQGLVKAGYVRGDTLLGAPYDFRKAANEQGKHFKDEQEN